MDFTFNEDQQLIQQTIQEFVADSIEESADTVLAGLAEMGFMGIFVPEDYSGAESDFTSYVLALEELAKHSGSTALRYAIQNTQVIYPILKYGSDALKEQCVPALASGEVIGAYAYSEAGEGEELYAIVATAKKDGANYIINGTKTFVLNGDNAQAFFVYANTEAGLSAFVVPADAQGVSVGEAYTKMGLDEVTAVAVTFTNVSVPEVNLVGAEGNGNTILKDVSATHGIALASIANGLGAKGIDKCIEYGKSRIQFKQPIINFDAPREMVGQMVINVESTRLLTYKAAVLKDSEANYIESALVARAAALRLGEQNLRNTIQVHGGYGYTRDLGIEIMFRDVKGLQVLENFERPLVHAIADMVID
ncbi:MAG: acyl-CoA dehydrogenase family protein [Parabacteroides sp.]|nr:acyl-CoA dehydrogenase family protein [Parabacteroides sp.]